MRLQSCSIYKQFEIKCIEVQVMTLHERINSNQIANVRWESHTKYVHCHPTAESQRLSKKYIVQRDSWVIWGAPPNKLELACQPRHKYICRLRRRWHTFKIKQTGEQERKKRIHKVSIESNLKARLYQDCMKHLSRKEQSKQHGITCECHRWRK